MEKKLAVKNQKLAVKIQNLCMKKLLAVGLETGTLRGRSALPQSTLGNRSSLCMKKLPVMRQLAVYIQTQSLLKNRWG